VPRFWFRTGEQPRGFAAASPIVLTHASGPTGAPGALGARNAKDALLIDEGRPRARARPRLCRWRRGRPPCERFRSVDSWDIDTRIALMAERHDSAPLDAAVAFSELTGLDPVTHPSSFGSFLDALQSSDGGTSLSLRPGGFEIDLKKGIATGSVVGAVLAAVLVGAGYHDLVGSKNSCRDAVLWMRPPITSRRRTSVALRSPTARDGFPTGVRRSSPRWGLAWLWCET
jgi:hypothetical protein